MAARVRTISSSMSSAVLGAVSSTLLDALQGRRTQRD
jgi:hypothetical protein